MSFNGHRNSIHTAVNSLESLKEILAIQAMSPIHGDRVVAAFSHAFRIIIDTVPKVNDNFMDLFINRKTKPDPWIENNLAFRAVHRWLLHPPAGLSLHYPEDDAFLHSDTFREILPIILGTDNSPDDSKFWADVNWRKVQSNKDRRYLILNLLRLFPDLSELLGGDVSVCDVGCSQNQGLKHIALDLPFGDIKLDANSHIDNHDSVQYLLNETANRAINLTESVGTDFFPINDADNREWVMACSLLPKELKEPGAREEYEFLESANVESVDFIRSDFANPNDVETQFRDKSFDIVTFFTILYQVSDEERRRMFEHALALSKRFILIADAAKVLDNKNVKHPIDSLHFDTAYFAEDYGYRVFLYDKERPDVGFVELWRMKSGRCESILILEDHELALSGIYRHLRA